MDLPPNHIHHTKLHVVIAGHTDHNRGYLFIHRVIRPLYSMMQYSEWSCGQLRHHTWLGSAMSWRLCSSMRDIRSSPGLNWFALLKASRIAATRSAGVPHSSPRKIALVFRQELSCFLSRPLGNRVAKNADEAGAAHYHSSKLYIPRLIQAIEGDGRPVCVNWQVPLKHHPSFLCTRGHL